ncbi:MAG: aldo/keto reductase, partial [Pseudomonadota bacterium]|nr:aldo/keto reductase [Pseudomonadota bacterium]
TMDQLESNLASESLKLDEEVLTAIDDIHRRMPNPCP